MIVYFDYDNSHIKDIELYYNKIIKKTNNLINNNIAKNMKSFIQINFKHDINDNIICFLDYIFIITSKNQKVLVQNRGQELFEYDDKATLQVICSRPKNFETDLGGTFDYVRYLKKDHIYAQCQFEKGTVHTRQPSFMKTLYLFSNRLSNRMDALFKTPHDNFIAGVLVGDKTDIAPEMRNDFIKTGTIHILALSAM